MAKWALVFAIISLVATVMFVVPFVLVYYGGPLIVFPISFKTIASAIYFATPAAGILAALALSKPEQRKQAWLALMFVALPTLLLIGVFIVKIFHIPYSY